MGDEREDLRAVVSKQGLALKGLQQAAADAEKRQKSYHAELLEMLATLLETTRKSEAQQKSVREQRLPTADTAEGCCVAMVGSLRRWHREEKGGTWWCCGS